MEQEAQQQGIELTEHEQQMTALVEEREAQAKGAADPQEAVEYVEETPEEPIDYKAKYEELIAKQQAVEPTEPTEPPKEPTEPTETPKEPKEEAAPSVLTPDQMDKYTQEFNTNGSLSEDAYNELAKLGVTKDVVDNYIQGQAALQEASVAKVYDSVGGAAEYNKMITWAKDTWSPEQISVFNEQVNSGDAARVGFSVEALKAQYTAAQASPIPSRTLSGTGGASSTPSNRFESKDDMYKAMNNKLYGRDASYTNMVANKIANSSF
jgi:hypothetical protein